jgi:hypothetical protein
MKATGGKREEACGATEAFPYCVPGDVTGPGLSGTDLTGATYISDYQLRPVNMPELAKALLAHGANPNGRIKKRYTRGPFGSPINMAGARIRIRHAARRPDHLEGAHPRRLAVKPRNPFQYERSFYADVGSKIVRSARWRIAFRQRMASRQRKRSDSADHNSCRGLDRSG